MKAILIVFLLSFSIFTLTHSQTCNTTVTNCLNCDSNNDTKCIECNTTYYLQVDGTCAKNCPNSSPCGSSTVTCFGVANCDTYTGDLTSNATCLCSQCKSGFFLNTDFHACSSSCPTGVECGSATQLCAPIGNCAQCVINSNTTCQQCSQGYFLSSDSTQCLTACPNNTCGDASTPCHAIADCSNASYAGGKCICFECNTTYVLSADSSTCLASCPSGSCGNQTVPCYPITNCSTCNNSDASCAECQLPYILNETGQACVQYCQADNQCGTNKVRCQTMQHCGECGSDTQLCGACEYGYVLSSDGSQCLLSCPDGEMCGTFNSSCYSAINNCSTAICVSGVKGCNECVSPYFLANDSSACVDKCASGQCGTLYHMCLTSNLTNCDVCSSATACQMCNSKDYCVDSTSNECVATNLTNCQTCSTNGTVCTQCNQPNYCLSATVCVLFNGTGCSFCSDAQNCTQCDISNGYTLVNGNCTNSSMIANCLTYQSTGSLCTECQQNYFLTTNQKECIQDCTTLGGYYNDVSSKKCLQCDTTMPNCTVCNTSSSCFNCTSGNYLNSAQNGCVAQCQSHEFLVTAANYCQLCDQRCGNCTGNYVTCTSCNTSSPFPWFTHNDTSCAVACQQDYFSNHTDYTCSLCTDFIANCTECDSVSTKSPDVVSCTTCTDDYFRVINDTINNQTICKNCSDLTTTNCTSCTQNSSTLFVSCQVCANSLVVDQTNLTQCVDCTSMITNCSTCTQNNATLSINCTACAQGTVLKITNSTTKNNTCVQCGDFIQQCNLCNQNQSTYQVNCTQCNGPTYVVNQQNQSECQFCSTSITNCTNCSQSSTDFSITCNTCANNTYWQQSSGPDLINSCVNCSTLIANCDTCFTNASSLQPSCSKCLSGYYLTLNDQKSNNYSCVSSCQGDQISTGMACCNLGYVFDQTNFTQGNFNCIEPNADPQNATNMNQLYGALFQQLAMNTSYFNDQTNLIYGINQTLNFSNDITTNSDVDESVHLLSLFVTSQSSLSSLPMQYIQKLQNLSINITNAASTVNFTLDNYQNLINSQASMISIVNTQMSKQKDANSQTDQQFVAIAFQNYQSLKNNFVQKALNVTDSAIQNITTSSGLNSAFQKIQFAANSSQYTLSPSSGISINVNNMTIAAIQKSNNLNANDSLIMEISYGSNTIVSQLSSSSKIVGDYCEVNLYTQARTQLSVNSSSAVTFNISCNGSTLQSVSPVYLIPASNNLYSWSSVGLSMNNGIIITNHLTVFSFASVSTSSGGLGAGAIAGIVIGIIAFMLILGGVIYIIRKKTTGDATPKEKLLV